MGFNTGFYAFSENVGMNFQLNRFWSMGALEKAELEEIGRKATDFEKWIALFSEAGDRAAAEGDHLHAVFLAEDEGPEAGLEGGHLGPVGYIDLPGVVGAAGAVQGQVHFLYENGV